jgi:transcription initiation factor TFIID TATA-box-binding protein
MALVLAAISSRPEDEFQGNAFSAMSSLSDTTGDMTSPCTDVDSQDSLHQLQQSQSGNDERPSNDNAPTIPVATPGGGPSVSKIVPTVQ